jgi:hypothetical protein
MTTNMLDPDTINQVNREQRAEVREQKREILSRKVSPAKKQALWNTFINPPQSTDDSYLAGLVF